MRVATLILALACVGCQDSDPAPPPPGLGSGGPGPGVGGGGNRDGGSDDGAIDDDAMIDAATDASMSCTEVSIDDFDNRALVIQGGTDLEFTPQRAFAAWTSGPCDGVRQLVIILTEGEECRSGIGRRLVFLLDADQIGDGLIPVGSPIQIAFSTAMAVIFVQPPDDGVAATSWRNCTGSDGDVTWEFLSAEPGRQTGVFNLNLLDCTGDPAAVPISVTGQVDVVLDAAFEDVCVE